MNESKTNGTEQAAGQDDTPRSICPRCQREQADYDGFGVMLCESCGYCAHPAAIVEAVAHYRDGQKVRMDASGRFNRSKKIQSIDTVEHINLLETLDAGARLDELKLLRDGWLDGNGTAPPHSALDWLATAFHRLFPDDLPSPYLYPTAAGGVRAEWSLGTHEASLDIDVLKRHGEWHSLNMSNDAEATDAYALQTPDEWNRLADRLRQLVEMPK